MIALTSLVGVACAGDNGDSSPQQSIEQTDGDNSSSDSENENDGNSDSGEQGESNGNWTGEVPLS